MHHLIHALCVILIASCASNTKPSHAASASKSHPTEDAQQLFFPESYDHRVGDFVLSLPIGHYEFVLPRLGFAMHILENGQPQPVIEQEKYLTLPADALAPKCHYLLLDQRHLLTFSEHFQLDGGYPAKLKILRRTSDAGWSNVTNSTVPAWAQSPRAVSFAPDYSSITVTSTKGDNQKLSWKDGRLEVHK